MINNLIYNPQWQPVVISGCSESLPTYTSAIGNHLIMGTDSNIDRIVHIHDDVGSGTQVYLSDNKCESTTECYTDYNTPSVLVGSSPVPLNNVNILDSEQTESYVLTYAGARPFDRDSVDNRIVNDVISGTGTSINSQDDVGGWPLLEENTRTLTLPDNPHEYDNGNGYTNLEEWLHAYAAGVEKIQQEFHRSDINQDGCIALDEMTNFMDRWKISSLDVTMIELMESITLWKSGIGCS